MERLSHIALSNGLLACVIALAAVAAARWCKRPALVHSLWLLALLKLLTPPIIDVPVKVLPATQVVTSEFRVAVEDVKPENMKRKEGTVQSIARPNQPVAPAITRRTPVQVSWRAILLTIWLAGSLAILTITITRVLRFGKLLRHATPADRRVIAQAAQVAHDLGLARCPPVLFVSGAISPMLWAVTGQARLLIPVDLWRRLDDQKRLALLAHEMAHLKRRDHWVRWLELIAGVVWWWHPVIWWGRRELREAEEQCCDAWVLWAMPQAARTYATALLDTVDFVSETHATPIAGASGAGAAKDLKRRLIMIMKASNPKSLSSFGRIIVLALGLIALPALPRLAAGEDKEKPAGDERRKEYEKEFDRPVRKDAEPRREADIKRDAEFKGEKVRRDAEAGVKEPSRKDSELINEEGGYRVIPPPEQPVSGIFSRFERNAMIISDDEHDRDIRAGLGREPMVSIDGRKASTKELRPGMPVHVSAIEGSARIEARRPRWMKADVVKEGAAKFKEPTREGEKTKEPVREGEKIKVREGEKIKEGVVDREKVKGEGERIREGDRLKDGIGEGEKAKEGARDGGRVKEGPRDGEKIKEKTREGGKEFGEKPRDGDPVTNKAKALRGQLIKVEGGTLVLAVGDAGRETFVGTEDDTRIIVNGKLARLADLEHGMSVTVQQVEGVTTVVEARSARGK